VRASLALLLVGLAPFAAAAQPPSSTAIKPAAVAAAAKHPGPLRVEPEATSELSKGFGTPLWAVGIDSHDESFGHVSVFLVARGSFLTESMRTGLAAAATAPKETATALRADLVAQLQRATESRERVRLEGQLKEFDAVAATGPITQRLELPGGKIGYGTMLGFSASGATFITVLPSPDDQYELVVATGASIEGEHRVPNPASAEYERLLREHPLQISEAIAQAVYKELFADGTGSQGGSRIKDQGLK
jgi:hypothetical protein